MKLSFCLMLSLFFISAFAQNPSDLIGTYRGKIEEVSDGQTFNCKYSIQIRSANEQKVDLIFEASDFSNGQANIKTDISADYKSRKGFNTFVIPGSGIFQSKNKSVVGVMVFVLNNLNGKNELAGSFTPFNEKKFNGTLAISPGLRANTGTAPLASGTSNTKLIHPAQKVKLVEAENMYYFNYGYAVVQKGSSFALINGEGNVVIPYNKYNFDYNVYERYEGFMEGMNIDRYGFVNGSLVIQDTKTQLRGVMNEKLEIIIPCVYASIDLSVKDYIRVVTPNSPGKWDQVTSLFDKNGKKIATGEALYNYKGLYPHKLSGGLYGFVDYTGKVKLADNFVGAMKFSEGLAAVAKNDEFNITKWGYINTSGKLVIPYMFRNRPGEFHNGLAVVDPVVTDEFNFAYINTKGEVVIKLKSDKLHYFSKTKVPLIRNTFGTRPYESFLNGYSLWFYGARGGAKNGGFSLVDTLGNVHIFEELLKEKGWKHGSTGIHTEFINNEVIITSSSGVTWTEVHAIANAKGEVLIQTALEEGQGSATIKSLFDPVSGLAKMIVYEKGKEIPCFVNRNGEITISLAPPNKW